MNTKNGIISDLLDWIDFKIFLHDSLHISISSLGGGNCTLHSDLGSELLVSSESLILPFISFLFITISCFIRYFMFVVIIPFFCMSTSRLFEAATQ